MARVFFTVLTACVAFVTVMAIPFPQEDAPPAGGDAATTAAPAAGGSTAAPVFDPNDCKQYESRCKNGSAQGSNLQNNGQNPLQNYTQSQNDAYCNSPQLEAFCKQMNSNMNVNQGQGNQQLNQNAINQAPVFGQIANSNQTNNFNAIQNNIQNPQAVINNPNSG